MDWVGSWCVEEGETVAWISRILLVLVFEFSVLCYALVLTLRGVLGMGSLRDSPLTVIPILVRSINAGDGVNCDSTWDIVAG
jgi:hypothetical protein